VLLEAAAAGRTRIASRVGGNHLVIDHEKDGLLVESENVTQLAAAIELAIRDESLRTRLGEAARKRAQLDFSAPNYFSRLRQFVLNVVEQSPQNRSV